MLGGEPVILYKADAISNLKSTLETDKLLTFIEREGGEDGTERRKKRTNTMC